MTKQAAYGSERLKIALVCSHGGHLTEMLQLLEAFKGHEVFFFCYDAPTTRVLNNAYLVPNMARNPIQFVLNLVRIYRIFRKEKPDLLVSTGAEIAIPAALIARLLGVPILYVECGAQVTHPSLTGRLLYWISDKFYVQWPELLTKYGKRAQFRGSLIDSDSAVVNDRSFERRLRVCLVQPRFESGFSSEQPPLGLAYIASVLEQTGCLVRVIDANVERLSAEEVLAILLCHRPDMVCVTVTTPLVPAAKKLALLIRQQGFLRPPLLVAGGPHATVLPEDLLNEDAYDLVVRGEGEETIRELVNAFLANKDFANIPGLSLFRSGSIHHAPNRTTCVPLDSLPYPDWSLFPVRSYSSPVRRHSYSLPILTSRGCPHKCTFCYKGVFGRDIRMREPEDVVAEWQHLVTRYGVQEVAVIDDVFTESAKRAKEICRRLVQAGLQRVPWATTNGIRVTNVTPELMSELKSAGCYRVYFGVESGVQRIVDALGKNISLEQVRYAVYCAKQAGLEVGLYFMLGNLGECEEDMEETIRFAIELDPDLVQFTIATPYPGTAMYEQVLRDGRLLVNSWEDFASYGGMIFEYAGLNPDMVNRKFREALRRFYFRPRYMFRQGVRFCSYYGFIQVLRGGKALTRLLLSRCHY
ncbi:MAG TPA: PssD/Cps14F family polysaccharide biosynthesis glycosyltransferase [Candidatus Hydrogenedentes bacterium]|nr:PssD/Cps14F family polysaccharide biosynthesis glycosyltransferase [Candidatus Hydrogenedentota bacterium]HOL75805.1 PssD/Cps14F family polysaccharide biosynthesis glycosyltransferase [Candidatus Hydrogenedentota bacterium]HPO87190.1 PssD/Cps14F family polysaccharide biosynthesis glycosyltransferase [Candidatus Hydrogenedentota bacterium]